MLATRRSQADRALAFRAFHGVFQKTRNTYASLCNGVCQDEWFHTRAREYQSTVEAALYGNDVPSSVAWIESVGRDGSRFYIPQPVEQPDSGVIHVRMGWAK